jgi:type II secretory pathway pseudopilin PulG
METPDFKKRSTIWMVVAIILLVACAILTWQLVTKANRVSVLTTEKQGLTDEKAQMITKLENLQKDYDKLGEDHKNLNDMFEKEKAHVEELLAKVRPSQGSVDKYKKQVDALEARLKEYETQIDQLKTQNKDLTAKNFVIKTSLDSTVTENKNLQTENTGLTDKVNKGSVLTAYDLNASGIKVGSKKEIPTVKSKRADKIRVCFTLGENVIAVAGKKDVYVRIADPSGNILCKGTGDEYSFMMQDKKLQYSIKENIMYQNKSLDLCLYWAKTADFVQGKYIVDIFVDGVDIATTDFVFEK